MAIPKAPLHQQEAPHRLSEVRLAHQRRSGPDPQEVLAAKTGSEVWTRLIVGMNPITQLHEEMLKEDNKGKREGTQSHAGSWRERRKRRRQRDDKKKALHPSKCASFDFGDVFLPSLPFSWLHHRCFPDVTEFLLAKLSNLKPHLNISILAVAVRVHNVQRDIINMQATFFFIVCYDYYSDFLCVIFLFS